MRTGFTNQPGIVYDAEKKDRFFAEDMQAIADYINTTSVSIIKNLYLNLVLAFFKLSVYAGLTKFNLVDGFIDEYEDSSGIDLVNSVDIIYNANDYLVQNFSSLGLSLIARFTLNDNSADKVVVDDVGAYDGTSYRNTDVVHVAGKVGSGALSFNGTSDYVDLGTSLNVLNNLSVFLWAKASAVSNRCLVGKYDYGINKRVWSIFTNTGTGAYLEVRVSGDGGNTSFKQYRTNAVVFDNTWKFIGFTFANNVLKIYVNGVEVAYTEVVNGTVNSLYNTSLKTYIGTALSSGSISLPFQGSMDELRIYDSVVSEDTILDLYNGGNGTENIAYTISNMTLISNATSAEEAPTNARIVIFEEDVDAITLNTDIKAFVSRDGIDYTEITLTDEGDYETGKRIISGYAPFTSDTGTDIKYKIQSFNNKALFIHGTAVQWD